MTNAEQMALQRLAGAIAIPTVSTRGAAEEWVRFEEFRAFLRQQYPLVHSRLQCETVAGDSLLYTWKGSGNGRPFALLAHQDVVPVEAGTEDNWAHPPFSGAVDDTYVWGRGSSDVKCLLIAILEAAEGLLARNYTPDRDIYFCFGHNEEILAGEPESGADCMAKLLLSRGVRLEFVMDEGGAVLADSFMGIGKPLAAIGTAEKGYCDFMITVEGPGGHAAEPPAETAVTQLSRLLLALRPAKPRLTGTVNGMLHTLGVHKGGAVGFVLRHAGVFWPLLCPVLMKNKQTAAMLRTTCVATMLSASPQANVLPQKASATLNARILPGDTADALLEDVRRKAKEMGIRAQVRQLRGSPPPAETRSSTPTFDRIAALSQEVLQAIPMMYLVTGRTDSAEYAQVADEIYRFYPFSVTFDEMSGMHGTNERLRCDSFLKGIEFLTRFIQRSSGG